MKLFSPKHCPDKSLFVITTIFNPQKFESRGRLYRDFEARMLRNPNVVLIVIEAVFQDNQPEIVERVNDRHYILHVHAHTKLWLKENLINIAIKWIYRKFPRWKYMAWIDADVAFARPDWKSKTIELLQKYAVIQMFSHVTQLNSTYQPLHGFGLGFMEGWTRGLLHQGKSISKENPNQIRYGWCGAPGGAWAATREAMDILYPIFDINILGGGDYHMAIALMGWAHLTFNPEHTQQYKDYLMAWQHSVKSLVGRVGYMNGLLLHYWHGKLADRGYDTRWKILVQHKFNPYEDIVPSKDGVFSIHPGRTALIKDMEEYFKSRKEDQE